MPALPPVPSVLKIDLRYSDNANTNVNNGFYLKYSGSVSAADLATLLNTIGIAWSASMAPQCGAWLTLEEIIGNDLASQFGAQATHFGAITGTSSGANRLSSGAAAVLSKKESDKYRGGHSRIYLPGIPENSTQNSNTWSTAAQSAIANAWGAFINQVITTSVPAAMGALTDVIVHRYGPTASGAPKPPNSPIGSVPLTTPVVHNVTGYFLNPKVASQRRRNQQP